MNEYLELLLFTSDSDFAVASESAGVDSIIIDWENKHKGTRQQNYSTEINYDQPEDVSRISSLVKIPVTVRINSMGLDTKSEIQDAISNGAKAIMLPMATEVSQVKQFLDLVDGRAKTIVQIETQSLVNQCKQLNELPWDSAYIGLNDLMISRGSNYIWEPVLDGTVRNIYQTLADRKVGFAGVTVIGYGSPIPVTSLLGEMAQLGCKLSFLRRSFKRDIVGRDINAEIKVIRAFWEASCQRRQESIDNDHKKFFQFLTENQT